MRRAEDALKKKTGQFSVQSVTATKTDGKNKAWLSLTQIIAYPDQPGPLLEHMEAQGVKMVLSKTSVSGYTYFKRMERFGYKLKNGRIAKKYKSQEQAIPNGDISTIIHKTPSPGEEKHPLEKMARLIYCNDRHYDRNRRIKRLRCTKIYARCITNICLNLSLEDMVLVAEVNQSEVCFLPYKILQQHHRWYAADANGYMSALFRNQVDFKKLAFQRLHCAQKLGLNWTDHNVMLDHLPVNRSFSNTGIKNSKSFVN